MTKSELIEVCDVAITTDQPLMVIVSIFNNVELIINCSKNIPNKLEYYINAYEENLVLKSCDKIKIIEALTDKSENLLKIAGKYL